LRSPTVSEVRISAEPRTEFGKGGARRTRRAGKIPAVLYGHGTEPRHISLPARDFTHAIKGGINTLLTLQIEGADELALPKAIQRDPLKGTFDHVDLLLVKRGEKVTVDIVVTLVGSPVAGTAINHDLLTLTVEAEATHIPDGVEVSVDGLEIGDQVTAGQVNLPQGTTLVTDPDALVLAINAAQTAEQAEAQIAGLEAEAGQVHQAPAAEAGESASE
jgi:large subunit ribosomal protein L25